MRFAPHRPIALILVILLLPHLTGCHRIIHKSPTRFKEDVAAHRRWVSKALILGVTTIEGKGIGFDQDPGGIVHGDTVVAQVRGERFAIALTDVKAVWVSESQMGKTNMRVHHTGKDVVLIPLSDEKIVGATTVAGLAIEFDEKPRAWARNDTLHAYIQGEAFSIALDQVKHVWISRFSGAMTLMGIGALVGVGLLVTVLIVAATKESCPFVYSWDGEQYVFDAEPYGGAVTKGLERDDYSELEHLRPDMGLYRLMVTNEVSETQYTNQMRILVVDHPPDTRVKVDEFGRMYSFARMEAPRSARDRSGRDLLPWLAATDRVIWESYAVPDSNGGVREDIDLTFSKPRGVTAAFLVTNLATGQWGSHMIRELLSLRGGALNEWYQAIDAQGTSLDSLQAWNVQNELYVLKIHVKEPDGWMVRGLVPGGGPFIAEDRVVPLDISQVSGDSLEIRIRPPRGFWALNSFAVAYGSSEEFTVEVTTPLSARTSDGRDALPALLASDDDYYVMPNTGDQGYVSFSAPPLRPGMSRTLMLHTRGYYRLHLTPPGTPDLAALHQIAYVPDAAAHLAADRFAELQVAQRSRR